MRSNPGLGLVNFALVSAYFVPAWGHDALRVLTSPYNGFEDRWPMPSPRSISATSSISGSWA